MNESIFNVPWSEWGAYQVFEFVTSYLIPIVASLAIIIGGLWTAYKYFTEKNREFYSNILKNVYSPLFNELVKNEFGIKIILDSNEDDATKKEYTLKELPFVTWNGVRTNTTMTIGKTEIKQEEYSVFNMDDKLKEICDDEDKLKYAPRDLVALIKSYFFLECVKGSPTYKTEKVKIQLAIRRNIIIEYNKYRKKLGLRDVSMIKYCHSFLGWIWFK